MGRRLAGRHRQVNMERRNALDTLRRMLQDPHPQLGEDVVYITPYAHVPEQRYPLHDSYPLTEDL